MLVQETLISRGKNKYLVHMFRTAGDNLYIFCYREDPLGEQHSITGKSITFSELKYLKRIYFKEDEHLQAYVHYNKLVSMFRDSKTYGDVT